MTRRRLQNITALPPPPPPPSNDVSPNILITVLILAVAVLISATLYLFLRFLRRNYTSTSTPPPHPSLSSTTSKVTPSTTDPLLDTLPLFPFDSLSSTGDCAVCLSKFEAQDLLRLLPICCHAFHAECIDTWIHSNQTCPLCRSPVFLNESELLSKLQTPNPASISSSGSSFRVEIGNVSQRNNNNNETSVRRSYSLGGNFEYILNEDDDVVSEVHSGSFRRTFSSEFKSEEQQQQGILAAEIGTRGGGGGGGGGGGWLKEYLSHSLSSSFRSSGRWFFTGSSRRENVENIGTDNNNNNNNRVTELDLEASRLGDEISELFRWLSGV